MAFTLLQDPAFQKFNTAKENLGNYFRFTKRSTSFAFVFMALIPSSLAYFAYANEGKFALHRLFRTEKLINGEEYSIREKDL